MKIDFISRSIVEYESNKLIKGLSFSHIQVYFSFFLKNHKKSCQNSNKNDEFLLSIIENSTTIIYLYKVRFSKQRDLLVQTLLLAKDFHEKHWSAPVIRNPNEKYSIDMNKSSTKVKNSVLKLVVNDRYIPARSLFKVVLFEKVSFPGFNRKFHMIMGHSSIVLSKYIKTISGIIFERDDEAKSIERILPLDSTFVNMMKSKEPDCKTDHFKKEI